MKIIVGLGNPGIKYKNTRHNLGFRVLDILAKTEGIEFRQKKWKSYIGKGTIEDVDAMLVKPSAYMNNSGIAVNIIVNQKNLLLENLLVVCDDFQLPPGKIRIRRDGSSGGHKGLESIIRELGTDSFPRLRIGIGLPVPFRRDFDGKGKDVIKYVLENFTKAELAEVNPVIERALTAIREYVINGVEAAMNKFN